MPNIINITEVINNGKHNFSTSLYEIIFVEQYSGNLIICDFKITFTSVYKMRISSVMDVDLPNIETKYVNEK